MLKFLFSICSEYCVDSSDLVYVFLMFHMADTAKIIPTPDLIEHACSN